MPSQVQRYIESMAKCKAEGLVKFQVPSDGDIPAEWMWAKPLKDDLLEVKNIPFFAEIGLGDIVKVGVFLEPVTLNAHDEDGNHVPIRNLEDGFLRLERIVERHSWTVRVLYETEGCVLGQQAHGPCGPDEIIRRIKEIETVSKMEVESARPGFLVMAVPVETTELAWGELAHRLGGIDFVTDIFFPEGEDA